MPAATGESAHPFAEIRNLMVTAVTTLGDLAIFSSRALGWMMLRRPGHGTLLAACYNVGVLSVPVVAITGWFIGMVMAIELYSQLTRMGYGTHLGSFIDITIVKELGPVLAASMIAGRVGSAMAAELGTMRVTEQIDALACMGVNPVHYLVVPRFLACVLLVPLLTVLADFMGIMGGAVICTKFYGINSHHYWANARVFLDGWDISFGIIKSFFFGGAIALISCHRGFNCRPGAEGVGRGATEAFVFSFIAILTLDFFLDLFLNSVAVLVGFRMSN